MQLARYQASGLCESARAGQPTSGPKGLLALHHRRHLHSELHPVNDAAYVALPQQPAGACRTSSGPAARCRLGNVLDLGHMLHDGHSRPQGFVLARGGRHQELCVQQQNITVGNGLKLHGCLRASSCALRQITVAASFQNVAKAGELSS